MPTATMTSKGQITIPKQLRDELHLSPGAKVMFVKRPNGRYEIVPRTGRIQDLAGILYDPDRPTLTLEEMEAGIVEGATERAMRGLTNT